MKNKKTINYNPTFEEAVAWYDGLSCEAKKVIQANLNMLHINSNAYAPYHKITEMLDWFDYCIQNISKKNKVKWAKGDSSMISKLTTDLYPLNDTANLRKAIFVQNKTVPISIEHLIPEEIKKSRLFENPFVYAKKVNSDKQTFLSVSSMENENEVGSKTYYLDPTNFETQFINRYDNTDEMIAVDNNVGPFLTEYFSKILNPQEWRYAFTKTEDPEKLKVLYSIIDVEKKKAEKTESKDPKLDK